MTRGFNGPPSTHDVGGIDHPDAWGFYDRITPAEALAPAVARARRPIGIPYAPASHDGSVTCPECGLRVAEEHDEYGETTTRNYALHYADVHDPFGTCRHGVYNATPCPDCTEEAR